jgi:hypothetical protein
MLAKSSPLTAKKDGELAAVAALCHNADRLLQKELGLGHQHGYTGKVDDNLVIGMVNAWLDTETINQEDKLMIVDAVLNHPKCKDPKDSLPLQILKDADQLVNIEADCIQRDGQFFGNELPIFDPVWFENNPNASWKKPGCMARAIREKFDWNIEGGFVGLRLPKARALAQSRFAFYQLYLDTIRKQQGEMGLVPYPVELV